MSDAGLGVIAEVMTLHPWLCAAPASVVLQLVSIARLRGVLRSLSVILTVVTAGTGMLATAAYLFDPGNAWQLVLLLAGPPVFVLTSGVLVLGLVVNPSRDEARTGG